MMLFRMFWIVFDLILVRDFVKLGVGLVSVGLVLMVISVSVVIVSVVVFMCNLVFLSIIVSFFW